MTPAITSQMGVNIGTKSLGYAVLEQDELIHWKVKTFTGIWSKYKLSRIVHSIAKEMQRYTPGLLVLKVPPEPSTSKALKQLTHALEKLAERKDIPITYCTLQNLTERFVGPGKGNKPQLYELLVKRFPELRHAYRKEQSNRHLYYCKVFEAVAAALMFSDENSCV